MNGLKVDGIISIGGKERTTRVVPRTEVSALAIFSLFIKLAIMSAKDMSASDPRTMVNIKNSMLNSFILAPKSNDAPVSMLIDIKVYTSVINISQRR